jgi:hypothetical protein
MRAGRPRLSLPALPLGWMRVLKLSLPAIAAVASGLLLYFLLAGLETALGSGLLASVGLEELCKCLLALAFALSFSAADRSGLARGAKSKAKAKRSLGLPPEVKGLSWALVAVAIFATAENLAYFAAFPGQGILLRLIWSEPVHLVSALAEASAIYLLLSLLPRGQATRAGAGPGKAGRLAGQALTALALLAFALAWHLGFNLVADGPLPALAADAGPAWRATLTFAALANLAALAALAYHFAHRVIVGGFLYGPD